MEGMLEMRDNFVVRVDHLKNSIKVWGAKQYFDLKYLFALLIQVASGRYSYTLKSIQLAFDSLYQIVLRQLTDIPDDQEDFLMLSLDRLTCALVSKYREIDLTTVGESLLALLDSGEPKPIILRFCFQILFNFDVWMHCPFATQLGVLQLAGQLKDHLKKPPMK